MFFRLKGKPPYQYLQIVENHRDGKRVVQRVIATLGRADRLQAEGLGARMRRVNEVRDVVLARAGRYHEVDSNLRVKEVSTEGRRYVVCYNPDEAKKDAADREAMVASLARPCKPPASPSRPRSGQHSAWCQRPDRFPVLYLEMAVSLIKL